MKYIHNLEAYRYKIPTAVTIGSFDGVHLGHQKILNDLKKIANDNKRRSVVISFDPHPKFFLNPQTGMRLLTTTDEKIALISSQKIDDIIIQRFDNHFAGLSAKNFIKKLVENIHMKDLLIGYDHRFGKNRNGTFDLIKSMETTYGFRVHKIESLKIDGQEVSSSLIRKVLTNGDVNRAQTFLGRSYFITGKVVQGNRLGRKLGFPTANIKVENPYKLIPKQGVYLVQSILDNIQVFGMMNIGYRPTIDGNRLIMEVHFFDFSGDLYGKDLRVYFLRRLRDELKFKDLNALQNQLEKDAIICRKIIARDFIK